MSKKGTFTKALLIGLVFGFLLQKGGVAKFHLLVGILLLEDFTVAKVMLSAIVVGMIGVLALRRLGLVEYSIKPVRYRANILGGLIFGVGFACSGYCPGTGAAAVGQLNGDAWFMVLGMTIGAYLYALSSRALEGRLKPGDAPKLRLPSVVKAKSAPFTIVFALALGLTLWSLDRYASWF